MEEHFYQIKNAEKKKNYHPISHEGLEALRQEQERDTYSQHYYSRFWEFTKGNSA